MIVSCDPRMSSNLIHSNLMTRPSPSGRPSPLILAWGRAQGAVMSHTSATAMGRDMTVTQMRLMANLMRFGRMSGRQLATALDITPSSVVPLVDRLEEKNFVERVHGGADRRSLPRGDRRTADRVDRRVTWIQLTATG